MIKLADTLAPMADFPAVMAEHTAFEDGETLQEKYETGQLGGGGGGYTQLSQADYDALSDDEKMNGKEYRTYDSGHIYKLGVEYGKDAYFTSLSQLGLTADVTLDDVITAMPKGSSVLIGVTEFTNAKTMFPYEEENDYTFGRVFITKGNDNGKTYAKWFRKDGAKECIAKMDLNTNAIIGWQQKNTKGLVTNAQNFKIDLTKNNASWYGMFTFNFVYGTTPCEITVTITDKVYYTITKGQNLVSALTYTQSGANYQIGIDLTAKVYGTQVVDMPSEFGTINSLTAEQFTGDKVATFKGYDAKPITELTDLGLDGSATIQNIMDKMSIGQHCIINTSRFDDKTEVNNIEYGKVEIRRLSSGTWSLWLEDVLHGNVVAHGTCSASKFAGWHYFATKSTYNSIAELNKAKGTNIELVNGKDNTKKIVDALSVGEQFISFYHNNANQNRFGIDVSYGNLIHELRITKCLDADLTANYATVTAFMNTGCVMSRIYYKTYSTDWTSTKDYVESLT